MNAKIKHIWSKRPSRSKKNWYLYIPILITISILADALVSVLSINSWVEILAILVSVYVLSELICIACLSFHVKGRKVQ